MAAGQNDEEDARKKHKKEKKKAAEEAAQAAALEEDELQARIARKKKRKEERQAAAEAAEVAEAELEEASQNIHNKEKRKAAEAAAQALELEDAELAKAARKKKKRKEERQAAAEAAEVAEADMEETSQKIHKKEKRKAAEAAAQAAELEEAELEAKAARKKKRKEGRQAVVEAAEVDEAVTGAEAVESADREWDVTLKKTKRGGKAARDAAAAAAGNGNSNSSKLVNDESGHEHTTTDEGAVRQSPKVYAAQDRDACRILIGSLQPDVTEDILRSHFEYCGEIVNVYVVTDRMTGNCKGVGFITFADSDGVAEALKATGSYLHERKINVSMATPLGKGKGKDKGGKARSPTSAQRPANCTGVVVKQLAFSATEDDLKETFKSCGTGPTKVKLLINRDTGQSKGMAFIDFAQDGVDVGKAVDEAVSFSGSDFKGRRYYVEYN